MQDSDLIRVSDEPTSTWKAYLKKIRAKADVAPDLDEITRIIEDVRAERYVKKMRLKLIVVGEIK